MEGYGVPAVPGALFDFHESTDTFFHDDVQLVPLGMVFVLQGIDVVAGVRDTSGHCWINVDVNGAHMFHDSQSIGEGQGIYSQWRGARPIFHNPTNLVVIDCYSDIAMNWSITGWGYLVYIDSGVPGFTI